MPRKIREIKYSLKFLKHLLRLPEKIYHKTRERERTFREDAFSPRLHTHKLHGKDEYAWAFWVDFTYRIKFIFLNEGEVLFFDVGTHDLYK